MLLLLFKKDLGCLHQPFFQGFSVILIVSLVFSDIYGFGKVTSDLGSMWLCTVSSNGLWFRVIPGRFK